MTVQAHPGRLAGVMLVTALGAGCQDPTLGKASPPPYLLVEKGPYQSFYGADGKIERLVYDRNGDGTADTIVLYNPDGKPREAQIDTDLDKVIDRWEYFENSVLVRVGYDDNRDGKPDRTEP
jgi:hypothetical protein